MAGCSRHCRVVCVPVCLSAVLRKERYHSVHRARPIPSTNPATPSLSREPQKTTLNPSFQSTPRQSRPINTIVRITTCLLCAYSHHYHYHRYPQPLSLSLSSTTPPPPRSQPHLKYNNEVPPPTNNPPPQKKILPNGHRAVNILG